MRNKIPTTNDINRDFKSLCFMALGVMLLLCAIYCGSEFHQWATRCGQTGCNNVRVSGKKYCLYHEKQVNATDAVPNEEKECKVSDCKRNRTKYSSYCEVHCCGVITCDRIVLNGSAYCSEHTCSEDGCYNKVTSENTICSSCREARKEANYKYYISHSSSSKGGGYPDCDDYEGRDDFLDDWDGKMPNGEDAEDYWDNW